VMALLDRNGVYGSQRFSVAAREHNVRPIVGCELLMEDSGILPVLVENRTGYKNLCELLTQAHLRSEKGKCAVQWDELPQFADGLVALVGEAVCFPIRRRDSSSVPYSSNHRARTLLDVFGRENVFVELQRHFIRGEDHINRELIDL